MNMCLEFLPDSDDGTNLRVINKSLFYYLYKIKKQLDYIQDWDLFKKLSYTYEFINTKVDQHMRPVCSYEPISRAYFKLHEIIESGEESVSLVL